ncbi:hypothetical protein KQX54_009284 [Cotesia glomerata]|uniref:Cysteine-rich secretory protein domain-containing protein n=1 Tax=Cotesia glomerata TaxID=32391 RepID=A0AAV7J0K5_COTGL|nr:hypothetical protein KQX54_009284 [Cotesia glomerata]
MIVFTRGNYPDRLGMPYKAGAPCSSCKEHCRVGKLCKNSCPWADLWANCRQLYETWPNWLCESDTQQGHERRQFCRATCRCRDKIVTKASASPQGNSNKNADHLAPMRYLTQIFYPGCQE